MWLKKLSNIAWVDIGLSFKHINLHGKCWAEEQKTLKVSKSIKKRDLNLP